MDEQMIFSFEKYYAYAWITYMCEKIIYIPSRKYFGNGKEKCCGSALL